jgi:hypothetical protein
MLLTSRLGMPEHHTRWWPLATTPSDADLTGFSPGNALGMAPPLTRCTSRHAQERQFVQTDVKARVLGAEVSRLPHRRQKHAPCCPIVAATGRCLTGLLIRLPRRLGRSHPEHETPHAGQQPYPQVDPPWPHHPLHIRVQPWPIIRRWHSTPSSTWCRESVDTRLGFAYDSIRVS